MSATVHVYENGVRHERYYPGGSTFGEAVFSPCERYRYYLARQWEPDPDRIAVFAMLNPSTADAQRADPTIRRCFGFARLWGCGRLVVVNIFALRATDPAELRKASDPVGEHNAEWVRAAAREACSAQAQWAGATGVVCAWGVHGAYIDQGRTARGWIESAGAFSYALGWTKDGHPRHPLYLPRLLVPMLWPGRDRGTPLPGPQ